MHYIAQERAIQLEKRYKPKVFKLIFVIVVQFCGHYICSIIFAVAVYV